MESLCRLCSVPEACPLCDIMRAPRRLTTRDLTSIGRTTARMLKAIDAAPAPAKVLDSGRMERENALRAQLEAAQRVNSALKARTTVVTPAAVPVAPAKVLAFVKPAPVTAPAPVAPVAPVPAPAPAPAPVVVQVVTTGPLAPGDWAGLWHRVESGVISAGEAEMIGRKWTTREGGQTLAQA